MWIKHGVVWTAIVVVVIFLIKGGQGASVKNDKKVHSQDVPEASSKERTPRTIGQIFSSLTSLDFLYGIRNLLNMRNSGTQFEFVPLGQLIMNNLGTGSTSKSSSKKKQI